MKLGLLYENPGIKLSVKDGQLKFIVGCQSISQIYRKSENVLQRKETNVTDDKKNKATEKVLLDCSSQKLRHVFGK
jgi:hypothetical protein